MFYQLHPGYWYRCDLVSVRPVIVRIVKTGEQIWVTDLNNLSKYHPQRYEG